jgi:hypothetical protein
VLHKPRSSPVEEPDPPRTPPPLLPLHYVVSLLQVGLLPHLPHQRLVIVASGTPVSTSTRPSSRGWPSLVSLCVCLSLLTLPRRPAVT